VTIPAGCHGTLSHGFVRYSVDLSRFAGQTVTIVFRATENSRRATSFVIDDTALTLG
jgi:hypothetical protein